MLRGKHKPTYTPHVDVGDFVVVVNAEKVAVTGKKREDKRYWRHSGYPGGIRSRTLGEMLERRPEEVLRKAVKGMVPRNRLGRKQLTKLKIYAGPEHPHAGPEAQDIGDRDLMQDDEQQTPDEQAPEESPRRRLRPRSRPPRRPGTDDAVPDQEAPAEEDQAPTAEPADAEGDAPAAEEPAAEAEEPAAEPESPREPRAQAEKPDKKAKKEEVVPGAELDPIAIEPERPARRRGEGPPRGRGGGARARARPS